MHGIAQAAIFGYGLFGLIVWALTGRPGRTHIMRVGIYHILARRKKQQQHPCANNMVFVLFQSQYSF